MAKPVRVGVIGASPGGSWGSATHLPALAALPQFTAAAVCTTRRETAEQVAGMFGIPNAFDDPRRLVEHPDVDVVAVAVRVPAHRELVTMAIEAGKHVYCEWPLARDTAEAEQLAQAAQRAGVLHMVGLQARRAPAVQFALDMIGDGAIGDLKTVTMTHSVPWTFGGRTSSAYLLDRDSGATLLTIPGGHSLDAIFHLVGAPATIRATLATLGSEAKDAGIARPSCNAATISGTTRTGVDFSLRLAGAGRYCTGVRIEISGSAGDLLLQSVPGGRGIQMADFSVFRTAGTGQTEPIDIPERYYGVPEAIRSNPVFNVAKAYLTLHDAISSGSSPTPDFNAAVAHHRVVEAVQHSSDTDSTVFGDGKWTA